MSPFPLYSILLFSIMFRLRRELKEVKNLKIWQQENEWTKPTYWRPHNKYLLRILAPKTTDLLFSKFVGHNLRLLLKRLWGNFKFLKTKAESGLIALETSYFTYLHGILFSFILRITYKYISLESYSEKNSLSKPLLLFLLNSLPLCCCMKRKD